MEPSYHLNDTFNFLTGPTKNQMIVWNEWAATALNLYHQNSESNIELILSGIEYNCLLKWDSTFSSSAMKERTELASQGGISLACFIMSVLLDFKYVIQTEIGTGVDYMFLEQIPMSDNFMQNPHYVEVSALLEEKGSNTLTNRLRIKHQQIEDGNEKLPDSSVIVTLFAQPKTIREIHI